MHESHSANSAGFQSPFNREGLPSVTSLLSMPLKLVPQQAQEKIFMAVLNHLFQQQMQDGQFDFLECRTVSILLQDLDIEFRITKGRTGLVAHAGEGPLDLMVTGNFHELAQLPLHTKNLDSLLGTQTLMIQGDEALTTEVEQILRSLDLSTLSIPQPLKMALQQIVSFTKTDSFP